MKLIALGDNVIDYYHNTQECFPGGNAVNVAVHAARLGAQAEYLGSLGDDNMAHIVEKALQENGVDISHCPVLQGRTTKVCSYDVVNGERSFLEVITGVKLDRPAADHCAGAGRAENRRFDRQQLQRQNARTDGGCAGTARCVCL